ncbi:MAG: carboxypeptidase-like regulatory domain-containing protein [Bacteroidales bacterium]|jgi:hypothetical protein|nr:carboxypeptidase-like regulatory domain-containing protein [Bacteroidales bacterium]
MKPIALFFACCLLLPLHAGTQESPDYIVVSGVVKKQRTNEKLGYVNVHYLEQNVSTITNADGEFTIKIKKNEGEKGRLEFSHLGYSNVIISVHGRTIKDTTIYLTPVAIILNPVTVHAGDPESIVRQAISKIKNNYNSEPSLFSGFYRETIKKRTNYVSISEAVIDIYKTSYTRGINADRVYIEKGRQIADYSRYDTLLVKYMGGPVISTHLDVVKNNDFFLTYDDTPLYNYVLETTTMIDDRLHFAIKFSPKNVMPQSAYYGIMYIDQENLTFSRIEFNLSMQDQKLATKVILRKKPATMHFTPEEVAYLCIYKQHNGKSYLYYVRNEVQFKCDWRQRLFSTRYTIVSEAVVTGMQQVSEVSVGKSSFRPNQFLTGNAMNFYDEGFWQNYNIIDPTESLESAVQKLLKRQ